VLALREAVASQLKGGAPQAESVDPAPLERVWKLGAVRRGEAAARALLRLLRVLPQCPEQRGELARFLQTAAPELVRRGDTWLSEVPCFSLKELAITGTDLAVELGLQPGPWMGTLLQQLLERTALGEIPNERESLLHAARAAK
jgi:tRNA nucleotidyltransferase (CCA-adding enzyme)